MDDRQKIVYLEPPPDVVDKHEVRALGHTEALEVGVNVRRELLGEVVEDVGLGQAASTLLVNYQVTLRGLELELTVLDKY